MQLFPLQLFNYFIPLIWKIFTLIFERWMYIYFPMNEIQKYLHVSYYTHFIKTIDSHSQNRLTIETLIQKFYAFSNSPCKSKKKRKKNSFQSSLKRGVKRERKTITLYLVFQHEPLLPDVWYPSCLSWPRYDLIVTGLQSDKAVRLREWRSR